MIESIFIHLESEASYLYPKEPLPLKNQYNKTIVLQLDQIFLPLHDSVLHTHMFKSPNN